MLVFVQTYRIFLKYNLDICYFSLVCKLVRDNELELLCESLGLRIKETKEVYEGEVTELSPVETENPMGGKKLLSVAI